MPRHITPGQTHPDTTHPDRYRSGPSRIPIPSPLPIGGDRGRDRYRYRKRAKAHGQVLASVDSDAARDSKTTLESGPVIRLSVGRVVNVQVRARFECTCSPGIACWP
jgi:hypothetical protein